MYVSLNARNVVSTVFNMQKKLADIGFGLAKNQKDSLNAAKKIGSYWKTELAQNYCRGTKRVLIDFDCSDETRLNAIVSFLEGITQVICVRNTVSGYHIVFEACDTRELIKQFGTDDIDIQRDSLVFVDSWEGTK